jgi:hypothetical protein
VAAAAGADLWVRHLQIVALERQVAAMVHIQQTPRLRGVRTRGVVAGEQVKIRLVLIKMPLLVVQEV